MDGLILSCSILPDKPYYMANADVYIYSLEELCYYIYNNIYLITSDFPEEGLVRFIDEELKEHELSEILRKYMGSNSSMKNCVLTILEYVDYYSSTEVNALRNVIDTLENLSVCEKLKVRGDNFLCVNKCESALRSYLMALDAAKKEKSGDDFIGNIYHNIGVAYGRLMLYGDASEYFKKAYEKNRNEESFKSHIMADKLLNGIDRGEFAADDELSLSVVNRIESAMDNALLDRKCQDITEVLNSKKHGDFSLYTEGCDRIIKNFKEECLCYMR